jgi:hypothetical protein
MHVYLTAARFARSETDPLIADLKILNRLKFSDQRSADQLSSANSNYKGCGFEGYLDSRISMDVDFRLQ